MKWCSSPALVVLLLTCWQAGVAAAADQPAASGPATAMPPVVQKDAAGACCAPSPEPCCPTCDCGDSCGHFVGGAGFYLLKAKVPNNVAFRTHTEFFDANGNFHGISTETDFHHDFEFAPRVWLGYTTACGLGVRGRWFHYEETSDTSAVNGVAPDGQVRTFVSASPFFGRPGLHADEEGAVVNNIDAGVGNTLLTHDQIRLDVWDIEATQELHICHTNLLVAGGVRYAHIGQEYRALEVQFDPVVPFPLRRILTSSNTFDGVGPTMALEVRRPIGNTGLALFGTARGSLLFGDRRDRVVFSRRDFRTGAENIRQTFDLTNDEVIPVGEIEVGAEWTACWGNYRPFVQAAFVGQSWFDAGSATSDTGNFGLVGLTVTAGLNY